MNERESEQSNSVIVFLKNERTNERMNKSKRKNTFISHHHHHHH